jgi:hypothetical protein
MLAGWKKGSEFVHCGEIIPMQLEIVQLNRRKKEPAFGLLFRVLNFRLFLGRQGAENWYFFSNP